MGILKKRVNEFPTPYTCANAIRKGGLETKLSMVLMGLGNIVHGQIIKGLLYLAVNDISKPHQYHGKLCLKSALADRICACIRSRKLIYSLF